MDRSDYTNASGYFCPTENEAVYRVDRGIRDSYTAPIKKRATQTMTAKKPQPPPVPKDENLKKARQMYSALCCIASMMDISIDAITLKCKGDPSRYKTVGDKKTIERVQA